MCFPEGMDELFEIVRFEPTDQAYDNQAYDIWLDEKKKLSDEDFRSPNIVACGYSVSIRSIRLCLMGCGLGDV